jgi:hypothetical protein
VDVEFIGADGPFEVPGGGENGILNSSEFLFV